MLIIEKLEIWKSKFLFYQLGQLGFYLCGPLSYKDYKLINCPGHSSTRHLSIVALEFCGRVCGQCTEVFLLPHLSVKSGVVDVWDAIICSIFYHLWGQFLFSHSKEILFNWIIPEYAY